jgi:signal transduction histidine kinase
MKMIQFAMVVVVGFIFAMSSIFIIIELRSRFDRSFILFGATNILLALFCLIDIELQPQIMTIGWTKIQHVIAAFFPVMILWYLMSLIGKVNPRALWGLAVAGLFFSFTMLGNIMFTGYAEDLAGTIFYDVLYVPFMTGSIIGITGYLCFHYTRSTGRIKADLGWQLIGLGLLGIIGIIEMINLMIGRRMFPNVPSLVVFGVLIFCLIVTAVFTNRLSAIIKSREHTFAKLQETYQELDRVRPLVRTGQSAVLFAHEVKNKAFGIALMLNSLRRATLPPPAAAVFEKCASIASAISRLGREVLMQASTASSLRTPFEIKTCIQDAAETVFRESRGNVAVDMALPEIILHGDRMKLRSVFDLLFTNSIQAGSRTLRVGAVTGNGLLAVTVEDDGEGCGQETLDYLFTPFFTTKPDRLGTGLGLSLAQNVVQNHGGAVSAYSKNLLGNGETGMIFCVVLPLPDAGPSALTDDSEVLVIENGLSKQLAHIHRILSNIRVHYRIVAFDTVGPDTLQSRIPVVCSSGITGLPAGENQVLLDPKIPIPAVRGSTAGAATVFTEASALASLFNAPASPQRSAPFHDAIVIEGH